MWSYSSISGYMSERNKSLKVDLFIIAKIWKQPKWLSKYERIKRYVKQNTGILATKMTSCHMW